MPCKNKAAVVGPGLTRFMRRGLAQAWGDLMQAGTVVIMGQ